MGFGSLCAVGTDDSMSLQFFTFIKCRTSLYDIFYRNQIARPTYIAIYRPLYEMKKKDVSASVVRRKTYPPLAVLSTMVKAQEYEKSVLEILESLFGFI